MSNITEASFPYDPALKLGDMKYVDGPDRLRWIPDRQMAQVLLDLWVAMQARDRKRGRK